MLCSQTVNFQFSSLFSTLHLSHINILVIPKPSFPDQICLPSPCPQSQCTPSSAGRHSTAFLHLRFLPLTQPLLPTGVSSNSFTHWICQALGVIPDSTLIPASHSTHSWWSLPSKRLSNPLPQPHYSLNANFFLLELLIQPPNCLKFCSHPVTSLFCTQRKLHKLKRGNSLAWIKILY